MKFPNEYFDLILIDGRVRMNCLKNATPKLKVGGVLIFDNSDRYELSELERSNRFKILLNDYQFVENDLFFSQTGVYQKE